MPTRSPRRATRRLVVVAVLVTAAMAWGRATTTGGGDEEAAVRRPVPVAPPTTARPAGLDPGLVAALEAAIAAARRDGHDLTVTSGYRTAAEQEALLAEAIAEHGPTEARRWVFPPDRSMHVRGLAVDVGGESAAAWLDDHGARFGLCRTLDWEWWHFEWRPAWEASGTCPEPVDDPADAPDARAGAT